MEGNPYARALELIRGQGADAAPAGDSAQAGLGAVPARMRLGTVLTAALLTVRAAGVTLPAEALRLNERLAKGAKWKARATSPDSIYSGLKGAVEGPVNTPHGLGSLIELTGGSLHSPDTVIDEAEVEQLEIDLEPGDEVLLLTEDDQVFYIVMKVVKAV